MDFLKKNLKYILVVIVVVSIIYYILSKKEGCCGYPEPTPHHISGTKVCPPGTKWNGKFCETPKTCQNTCFMSQEAHTQSGCPDDSNLGNCLNAWCAKKCNNKENFTENENFNFQCPWPAHEYEGNCYIS